MISKLQYISQIPHLASIQAACDAGCDWVQIRAKNIPEEDYFELALQAKKITELFGARLIVNDSVSIALKVGAYGVHLGKKDMKLAEATELAGKELIIGGSTNSLEDILEAVDQGVDYLGLGPFRLTSTKTDLNPVLGLKGIASIMNEVHKRTITVPIIAIGGITSEDIPSLLQAGVYGMAVSGTITTAIDKPGLVKEMKMFLS